MRPVKAALFIALTACLLVSMSALRSDCWAKSRKKKVILSTVGINEDHEVLGLVSYRSSELDPKKIHAELRKQAERMGADYVVGITYFSNAGYIYGSGTAVKLVDEE